MLQLVVANTAYRSCVLLPNGASLGREAMIAPFKPLMQPDVVLRWPDGQPANGANLDLFRFTRTTIFATDFSGDKWHNLLFRPDVGAVSEDASPELYARLASEAGPTISVGGGADMNLLRVYYILREDPAYWRGWCPLQALSLSHEDYF